MLTPINQASGRYGPLVDETSARLTESWGGDCALLSALSFSWARAYRELLVSGELRGRYGRGRIG